MSSFKLIGLCFLKYEWGTGGPNFSSAFLKAINYYNLGHNILRLFDVLSNFSFPTSETNRDY